MAARTRPLRPAPRGRRRRHRLLRLARRVPGERRCVRQGEPEAHRPSRLVAAVRRRHAQLPALARPQSPDRSRRGGARQHGGRFQADLGVRQSGQGEPDQRRDLPAAERPGLCRGRRPFRAAQHPREPAGLVPELKPDLRHLSERRASGSTTSPIRSGRSKSGPACRQRRRSSSIPGRTGRSCCIRPMCSSTRTAFATAPTGAAPGSPSWNIWADPPPRSFRRQFPARPRACRGARGA